MFTNQPVISIIIPAYNAERHIREALECVLQQDFADFEAIVVDDGSTDGTADIIAEFIARDSRLSYIYQANAGAGIARNTGIDLACGKYLMFLDSDDLFESNMLSTLYTLIEDTGAEMAVCAYDTFDDATGRFIERINNHRILSDGVYQTRSLYSSLFQVVNSSPCNKIFLSASIIDGSIRFPVIRRSEDYAFVLTAALHTEHIAFTHQSLLHYRIGQENSVEGDIGGTNSLTPLLSLDMIFDYMIYSDSNSIDLWTSYYLLCISTGLLNLFRLAEISEQALEIYQNQFFKYYAGKWHLFDKKVLARLPVSERLKLHLSKRCSKKGLLWACETSDKRHYRKKRSSAERACFAFRLALASFIYHM